MANTHLNIVDIGTTGSAWQPTDKINPSQISKIKDRSARVSNSLNAIPSPFSRLHIFETAFSLVFDDLRDNKDRASVIYKELVSDCLDGIELLYNLKFHESQGDAIEIVKWERERELKSLSESKFSSQKTLGKTLDMYLTQDFGLEHTEFFLFKHNGTVIAGTSPISIIFTTPGLDKKDGQFRSDTLKKDFHLKKPISGSKYFEKIVPFDKRPEAFQQYLISLFTKSEKLKDSAGAFWNYINFFKAPVTKETSPLSSIKRPDIGVVTVADVELQQNNDPQSVDIFESHIIRLPFRIDTKKFYSPVYEEDNLDREYDYLIPLKHDYLANVELSDIPRLVTYEIQGEHRVKVSVKQNPHDKKPKTKTFLLEHKDKRDGEVIDYNMSSQTNFTIGIFPFFRVASDSDSSVSSTFQGDYYKIMLGIDSQNTNIDNKDFNLNFFTRNRQSGKLELIHEDGHEVKVSRFDRFELSEKLEKGSIYFQVDNSAFDVIKISLPPAQSVVGVTGTILPNWVIKKTTKKNFDFAIDFGTTNTFIAYTDDEKHESKPKPFEISPVDQQMVMLNMPRLLHGSAQQFNFFGSSISGIQTLMQSEFIPPTVQAASNGALSVPTVPFRTVILEKVNLTDSEYKLLDNININFGYQLVDPSAQTSTQHSETNLKWNITGGQQQRVRVEIFIQQILKMIRYKVLLNGGDPSLVNVTWFAPQSLTPAAIKDYGDIWKKHFSETLKSKGKLRQITEAEAPFYYLKKSSKINDDSSVLTIDIGGGSTDIMLFVKETPLVGSSFNFAGNVFWGNGYNDFKDARENGIFEDLKFTISERIKGTNLKGKNEDLLRSASTEEIINFWLSNSVETKILEDLKKPKYRFSFLLHLSSVIYHCAQFIKQNGQHPPTCVVFSGNGSKYVDLIQGEDVLSKITGFFFRAVLDPTAKNPQIILPTENRKESTCYGGLYKPGIVQPGTMTYLGLNNGDALQKDVKTYKDLSQNPEVFRRVEKNIDEFIDLLFKLNDEINFKQYFNIEFKLDSLKPFMHSKIKNNLAEGFSKRKSKVQPEDEITDTLFFQAIIGLIFQLGVMEGDTLEKFEPKEVLYSKAPDAENYFLNRTMSNSQTFDSIFEVTIRESNPGEAIFSVIDSTPVYRRAIANFENVMKSVCEFEEYPSSADQVIKVLEPGILTKENDIWVIARKIKIEFI